MEANFTGLVVIGKVAQDHFIVFLPGHQGEPGLYFKILDDGSYSLSSRFATLKSQIERGSISKGLIGQGVFTVLSNNYDLSPSLSETVCRNLGTDGATCRDFIAKIGIRPQDSLLDFATTDPDQLTRRDDYPVITLSGLESLR